MLFKSYEKIEEDLKSMNLSEEDYRLLNKQEWVVTEKIHGANFVVLTNGLAIHYAKRKELLEVNDDFFGYKKAMIPLELNFLSLFEEIKQKYNEVIQISIYGELFGGGYPHPDVPVDEDVSMVQTGIYYSPRIEYCVFDIGLHKGEKDSEYLDYNEVLELCKKHGLFAVQPILIGKFSEVLNSNIHFESGIPAMFGLPKLDLPNKAEGVVIKPLKGFYLQTSKGKWRPVIKRKIEDFSEDVYTQASASGGSEARQRVLSMITKNRLNNAISKTGKVNRNDVIKKEMLVFLMMEDIREELDKLASSSKGKLLDNQKKVLMEEAEKAVRELVKKL